MLNGNIFLIFFNMKVCYVFSLESPHRGDSNEYKQHNIFLLEEMDFISLKLPFRSSTSNYVCLVTCI